MKRTHPLPNGRKVSEILTSLPEQFSADFATVAALKEALSGRAYGIFLLVLALPNLVPVPAPGLSAVLGVPLVLFTFQLMLGFRTPWFPKFIAQRKVHSHDLARVCAKAAPYFSKLERVITPRLLVLTHPPMDRLIALICMLLSLIIMLPVPFGNALPALAICLFALGILQRDGIVVILGLVVSAISLVVISLFISEAMNGAKAWLGF